MIIHDMDQQTHDWEQVRCGKWTASNFYSMMSVLSKDKASQTGLLLEKSAERITNQLEPAGFTNVHIKRGITYEPIARVAYEQKTGVTVQQVGFVELDVTTGCSPDGLVADDGMIEIKCPMSKGFLDALLYGKIKPQYVTQMQFCLYVTQRQWCDYVVYNTQFSPSISIQRIPRDEEHIARIAEKLTECNLRIDEIVNHYLSVIETKGD